MHWIRWITWVGWGLKTSIVIWLMPSIYAKSLNIKLGIKWQTKIEITLLQKNKK